MRDEDFEAYRNTGDFAAFERATRAGWYAFARTLLSRWRAPTHTSEADLVQEMLVTCWSFLDEWDPARGVSLRTYLTFNAIDKARKYLHKMRRAGHDGGAGRSRFELPFSALARDGEEFDPERFAPTAPPSQEHELSRRRMHSAAAELAPVLEVFERTGSLELAADFVLGRQTLREHFGGKRAPAREGVRRMIEQLSEQVEP